MTEYGHEHKFYLFKTQFEFIPTTITSPTSENYLYEKVDTAILSCACGETIRRKVRDDG